MIRKVHTIAHPFLNRDLEKLHQQLFKLIYRRKMQETLKSQLLFLVKIFESNFGELDSFSIFNLTELYEIEFSTQLLIFFEIDCLYLSFLGY